MIQRHHPAVPLATDVTDDPYYRLWPTIMPEQPPAAAVELYRQAFQLYGSALWNLEERQNPTTTYVLCVARALKLSGTMRSRAFAERIEQPIKNAIRAAQETR
jgi:hypothetical protein